MRRLLVLTCALFCLLVLTACQAKEQDIPQEEPPSTAQPAPEAPSDTSQPPAEEAEPLPYDANGDGILQTGEFPLPCGAAFGLEGEDAALYDAVAAALSQRREEWLSEDETLLVIPRLAVWGQYDGANGDINYVCGLNELYYYDLGQDLEHISPYNSGGGGGPVRITISADGVCTDIQETYDGADNAQRIRELCGPLTDLADALNNETDLPYGARSLAPSDLRERLNAYLDYYFPDLRQQA